MTLKLQQFPPPPATQPDDVAAHYSQPAQIKTHTVSLGPPIPSQFLLGTLRDGRLRVCSPITVKLMTEGDHVIAEAVEFNEFGFGKNFSEAVSDLQRATVELYLTLEEEQDRLGPDLQNVWTNLQQKIYRR